MTMSNKKFIEKYNNKEKEKRAAFKRDIQTNKMIAYNFPQNVTHTYIQRHTKNYKRLS